MKKIDVCVPDALALSEALRQSQPLASLRRRLEESAKRYAAVLPCIPAQLRPHVVAGPVDDAGWTLIGANPNVTAKLRQLQPLFEERLRLNGFSAGALRLKTRSV
jgi:hypothetical protein